MHNEQILERWREAKSHASWWVTACGDTREGYNGVDILPLDGNGIRLGTKQQNGCPNQLMGTTDNRTSGTRPVWNCLTKANINRS